MYITYSLLSMKCSKCLERFLPNDPREPVPGSDPTIIREPVTRVRASARVRARLGLRLGLLSALFGR